MGHIGELGLVVAIETVVVETEGVENVVVGDTVVVENFAVVESEDVENVVVVVESDVENVVVDESDIGDVVKVVTRVEDLK